MFQENEGGLEVRAKIHNTNVRTLWALLQHNYISGSGGQNNLRGGGAKRPLKPP